MSSGGKSIMTLTMSGLWLVISLDIWWEKDCSSGRILQSATSLPSIASSDSWDYLIEPDFRRLTRIWSFIAIKYGCMFKAKEGFDIGETSAACLGVRCTVPLYLRFTVYSSDYASGSLGAHTFERRDLDYQTVRALVFPSMTENPAKTSR
ncbi:hypothetical protein F4778DRAFT_737316 [Xylariomycetidae sp. FL2044]|nr:hypothetical protein F4778DRAFT_737316 [Xylariomycetidae sp. FL2044]